MKKVLFLALFTSFITTNTQAQLFGKKKKKEDNKTEQKSKSDKKEIKEISKKCSAHEGLFKLYQDTANGELYIEIKKEQLNKEYIYFSYVENGIVEAGLYRGSYRSSKVFDIQKSFDRIEFRLQNNSYYFDPQNAISKAANANINTPIAISEKIEAYSDSSFLIKASALFMDENFATIKPTYPPGYKGFALGKMSKDKSKIESIRNYPKNTDVRSLYVYENTGTAARGSSASTDGRFVGISYHHSIIEMPENDYKPRFDDPRVGYFTTKQTDLTSASATPFHDFVHRWHLVKKNPDAELSEPVEPITWWIENTTPQELRPIIKEGVEHWNIAFEKAGFKNAVVVKIQPDTADWDAGDIRYNVLRWTSSPQPPFGGYGPSFVNPRTGQILGADIMLEYVYILGRLRQEKYFDRAGLGLEFDNEMYLQDEHFCSAGSLMQEATVFANSAFALNEISEIEKSKFLVQSLKRLVLHEVGHTLGLNHNMKGSSIHSPKEIKDKEFMKTHTLCNSVMEYPSINFAYDKEEQTSYYDDKPGAYDLWAIEFAYSTALEDEKKEQERLNKILNRSTDPMLTFGNDADDMRSSGKGIDPRVNIYDLSNDPVAYGTERIKLIDEKLMPKLLTEYAKDGQSYQELTNAYLTLTGEKFKQLRIMTRQIGGIYVNRAFAGQDTDTPPYTPVAKEVQKAAIETLASYAFAPNALETDEKLLKHLQLQRRGFNFFSSSEDPKVHERILVIHEDLLSHLLHHNVLARVVNSAEYGNTYKLEEYLADLTKAIFDADKNSSVNHMRQNLQLLYTQSLIDYLKNKSALPSTTSQVLYEINKIDKIANIKSADISTQAHRDHLKLMIKKVLEP